MHHATLFNNLHSNSINIPDLHYQTVIFRVCLATYIASTEPLIKRLDSATL